MRRTLKVSWHVEEGSADEYTAQRLREVFSEFGGVEDIVVKAARARRVAALEEVRLLSLRQWMQL